MSLRCGGNIGTRRGWGPDGFGLTGHVRDLHRERKIGRTPMSAQN
jgi:hypothetical protein